MKYVKLAYMHAPTNAMTTPEIKGGEFQGVKGLEKTGGWTTMLRAWKSNAGKEYLEGNTPAGGPGTRSLPEPMGTEGKIIL